ncbi:unnamed protein product [Effrenium voratum]|nr:unnamed protein product [Effrenium voratum]
MVEDRWQHVASLLHRGCLGSCKVRSSRSFIRDWKLTPPGHLPFRLSTCVSRCFCACRLSEVFQTTALVMQMKFYRRSQSKLKEAPADAQEMQRAQQLGMAYLDQKQKEASMATRATSLLQVQTSRTNDERPEAKFNPFKPDPALARSSNPMLVEDEED